MYLTIKHLTIFLSKFDFIFLIFYIYIYKVSIIYLLFRPSPPSFFESWNPTLPLLSPSPPEPVTPCDGASNLRRQSDPRDGRRHSSSGGAVPTNASCTQICDGDSYHAAATGDGADLHHSGHPRLRPATPTFGSAKPRSVGLRLGA